MGDVSAKLSEFGVDAQSGRRRKIILRAKSGRSRLQRSVPGHDFARMQLHHGVRYPTISMRPGRGVTMWIPGASCSSRAGAWVTVSPASKRRQLAEAAKTRPKRVTEAGNATCVSRIGVSFWRSGLRLQKSLGKRGVNRCSSTLKRRAA